jgi:hypothetical protein
MSKPKSFFYDKVFLLSTASFALAIAAILGLALDFFLPIDYGVWRWDWNSLKECLSASGTGRCDTISKFPLSYLLNSFVSEASSEPLMWLNLVSLLTPVLFLAMISGVRIAIVAGSVYLLALLFSPLPAYYINSGALEVQAGVVSGIYVASLAMLSMRTKRIKTGSLKASIIFMGFLLPLYKDTLVAVVGLSFVLVYGFHWLYGILPRKTYSKEEMYHLMYLTALPILLGVLVAFGYNLLRYGVPWPVRYIAEANATTPAMSKSLEFLIGSLFSPNGGLLIFWGSAFILMVMGWRVLGIGCRSAVFWLGICVAFLSSLGFARWWAPFGWDSWGDRLMIQPMLALMVAMLLSVEYRPVPHWSRVKVLRAALLLAPIFLLSTYYAYIPFSSGREEALSKSLWPGPACDNMRLALREEAGRVGLKFWTSDTYYLCARERFLYIPFP